MKRTTYQGVHLLFILLIPILLSACGAGENTSVSREQTAVETSNAVETSTAPLATASAAPDEHGKHSGVEPAPAATGPVPHDASSAPAHTDGHAAEETGGKSAATKAADGSMSTPAAMPGHTPSPSETPPAAAPSSETPTNTAAPDPAAQEHIVEIVDFAFSPDTLEIKAGDRVKFVNKDEVRHSATADDESFDTGLLGLDEEKTIEFPEAGEFSYYCLPHPAMRGTILVTTH